MSAVIKVENLSKRYVIGHQKQERYSALRDVIADSAKGIGRKLLNSVSRKKSLNGDATREEFWALKDIDFEIDQGDRVGIIGRNGAGKSTLLKILSRITEPTTGKVSMKGRVASLLEVGTGFHPELTGRENIFLNAAILGMSKAEIKKKFDEIVYFAGIERFLDTPVKRYSSGMYVRLAFAVAANLEPEILIIDEVLAVGDAQFQKKCIGKMEEVSNEGRTILFVSHNMAMISNLCQTGILLEGGQITADGEVSKVIQHYYKESNNRKELSNRSVGSEAVELVGVELIGMNRNMETTIHDKFTIRMRYKIKKNIDARCVPNFHYFSADGNCIFVSNANDISKMPPGVYNADCRIPGGLLNEGIYFVGVAVTSYFDAGNYRVEFYDRNALTFNVIDPMDEKSDRYGYVGPVPGVLRPKLDWCVTGGEI
ncbi:MAG: hypothetical protein AMJ53_04965 [Gammaproteobacteria bacterium SG8_11]|nr:MAG: hypothetical protein AMJ53_04965 [Gammaproteobacteria bacterium SG8_11]